MAQDKVGLFPPPMSSYIKQYYANGKILYEGKIFNTKYHGKGKKYYSNGNLKNESSTTIKFMKMLKII